MVLQVEAKKLVNYVNSLGLSIPLRKPSHKHVGAIIADAVLQGGGHRYETQVKPRVERIRDKYPAADTVSGLSSLLKTEGAQALLNWSGKDEQERFGQTIAFFENEQINTFDDLCKWLESEANRDRLITKSNRVDKASIAEISDATADYYRVLVRLPDAVKIDSHVKKFLRDAGVTVGKYEYKELRAIVQLAAMQLGKRPIDLDSAIWNYRGEEKREKRGKFISGAKKEGMEENKNMGKGQHKNRSQLTQVQVSKRINVIQNKSKRTLCYECLGILQKNGCYPKHCREDNISMYDKNVLNNGKDELLLRFCPVKSGFSIRPKQQNGELGKRNPISQMKDFDYILNELGSWGRITWWP